MLATSINLQLEPGQKVTLQPFTIADDTETEAAERATFSIQNPLSHDCKW